MTKAPVCSQPLKSLAIPWYVILVISVFATIATQYIEWNDAPATNNEHIQYYYYNSFYHHAKRMIAEVEQYNYGEFHKPLFPLSTTDYRGFLCAILGLMIAAGGGIGGGGILVPIYILVMGFTPKHAIPLSNITVFGGSLANTYLNARKRHPLADRPLVDWDLILIMEPLTIAGALIGAFLNKLLREEVLTVMLVLLLSFTAYNTLKKAMKMYRRESLAIKEQSTCSVTRESELTTMANEEEIEVEVDAEEALLNDEDDDDKEMAEVELEENATLAKILEEEKKLPMGNITLLVIMFVVVLFINIMKGGGAFPSPLGIKCGSSSFWLANAIMLGWIILISLMARVYLLKRYIMKENCGYQ